MAGRAASLRSSFWDSRDLATSCRGESACSTCPAFPADTRHSRREARGLTVRAAGRSKAQPRARPKPKVKKQKPKGYDRPNLLRRGRKKPLSADALAQRLLESPQLSQENLDHPLLAACLSPVPLAAEDMAWMDAELEEVKEALGALGVGVLEGDWQGEHEAEGEHSGRDGAAGGDRGAARQGDSGAGDHAYREEEGQAEVLRSEMSASPMERQDHSELEDSDDGWAEVGPRPEWLSDPRLDQLLYLAFMHKDQPGRARHVKVAGSRLAFLGEPVVELALAELLLLKFPLETPASLRERARALVDKKRLPQYLQDAGLDRLLFPADLSKHVTTSIRVAAAKSVFYALTAVAYLIGGLPEVYRVLFEVFGLDADSPDTRPAFERVRDEDFLAPELAALAGEAEANWEDVASYAAPEGSLFPHPLLFHACVPPGIVRFRGCNWLRESLAPVLQTLAWPRPLPGVPLPLKQQRNEHMALALLLAFMHPTLFKAEHPRFCQERLEYIGQKIQHLVLAERLLLQNLDAPILWLQDRHKQVLRLRTCAKYLRDRRLEKHIWMTPEALQVASANFRFRGDAYAATYQAIHGCAYLVYGKEEVKRLMFAVWELEGGLTMDQPLLRDGTLALPSLVQSLGLAESSRIPQSGFTSRLA